MRQNYRFGCNGAMVTAPRPDANLNRFLSAYALTGSYLLTAAEANVAKMAFSPIASATLRKRKLTVRDAWQVGCHDVESAAIKPDDDVTILRARPTFRSWRC